MASSSALIALLVVVGCAAAASAATSFTVGDSSGWSTGVNYDNWASGKSFAAGDQLVFNYPSQAHTVTEVSKSDYDSCVGNALSGGVNDQSGSTTVTLTAGTHYYICAISGHCANGMKLAVTASGSGGSPRTPGTPSTPAPTGASARLQAGHVAVFAAAAALIKLAVF